MPNILYARANFFDSAESIGGMNKRSTGSFGALLIQSRVPHIENPAEPVSAHNQPDIIFFA